MFGRKTIASLWETVDSLGRDNAKLGRRVEHQKSLTAIADQAQYDTQQRLEGAYANGASTVLYAAADKLLAQAKRTAVKSGADIAKVEALKAEAQRYRVAALALTPSMLSGIPSKRYTSTSFCI